MTDDLKQRLRVFAGDPILGGVIDEAADRIEQLEVERDEAASAVRRLSDGQPFDAVVIADTVKRRTAQLEAERDELLACLNLLYSWANNWDSEFMNDPEWINKDGPRIKAAISKPKGQS